MDEVTQQRVLDGDVEAYGDVVRSHQRMLLGYALKRLGDWNLAEEVVQLTFIRAYQKLDEFRPEEEFGVWLCVTCRYMILTELEKRRRTLRNRENYRGALMLDVSESLMEIDEEESDSLVSLRDCVSQLPEESARLIRLRYFEKASCRDIADKRGRTVTWVTSTLSRIRKALRKCVEQGPEWAVGEGV